MSSDLQTLISLLDQWIPPHTSDLVRRLNTDSIDLNDDENAIETRDQVTTHVEHEAEDPHSRFAKEFLDLQQIIEQARSNNQDSHESLYRQVPTEPAIKISPQRKASPHRRSPEHPNSLLGNRRPKTPPKGRKPIRMIQEALEQRTAMLRSNPAELEAFMMQVGIWKRQAEIAAGLDTRPSFIARNRKEAVQDAGLKIQQQAKLRDEHSQIVLKSHQSRQEADQAAKIAEIQVKEQRFLQEQKERRHKHEMETWRALQKKWATLIMVGSRSWLIVKLLNDHHTAEILRIKRNHAARVIQRSYRYYHFRKTEAKRKWAVFVLGRCLLAYVRLRRVRKRSEACNMIHNFLIEVRDTSKLMKVIKQYRMRVLKAQSFARGFLRVKNAQIRVLELLWIQHETIWWDRKVNAAHKGKPKGGATAAAAGPKKKNAKNGKEKPLGLTFQVPEEVRLSVIIQDLTKRRKAHNTIKLAYGRALEVYNKKKAEFDAARSKLGSDSSDFHFQQPLTGYQLEFGPDGTPRRLHFRLLPDKEHLYALFEQGFTKATEHEE